MERKRTSASRRSSPPHRFCFPKFSAGIGTPALAELLTSNEVGFGDGGHPMSKIADRVGDRAKDETIDRSGSGNPDGSGTPINASDDEIAAIRNNLGAVDGEEKRDLARQLARPKHGTA
ncbi:hypothetical protein CO648_23020 [Rhizobium phaseoli]|uniref:Uncharacterized protein n=2 Tax=Rhizobium TaxID=379 RepID=B3Q4T6_RHIE6|nr:hypothetical protein RHECIAT_PC0000136 [Rhizobium etli CIAT 652]PCD65759.1 hypothetical protein CO648_23020 [Rhizobium phaseoli]